MFIVISLETFLSEGKINLEAKSPVLTWSHRCAVFSAGCNENDADHLDRDQQAYPPTQKTKRMRTSFKHHQLRTMKSYFAINHNPDAKDLKQLAQKTGLTKRVLQVSRAVLLPT